ncbi:major facilitator superfamily domain-containing protein [Cyathus striatus]|nr:major facilitator superfamily domain-containing protein [Cyathus striatus]
MSVSEKSIAEDALRSQNPSLTGDALEESTLKPPPKPPLSTFPDGGKEAWTVVVGAWLAVFVSFGFLNAFGVQVVPYTAAYIANSPRQFRFQAYYKTHQLSNESASNIAWIGGLQIFCIYFMGSIFGSLFDKFGAKQLIAAGGVAFSFSCMMQSICTRYWQFFLAQGLLQGICLSAMFSPSFACVNHWFSKRRGLALGIVTSGSSVGGVVWPIAIDNLIKKVGFGWALRTCGFISLALTALAWPHLGMFCISFGILFLIFYLPSYGALHGFDENMMFYSISILNTASFFGRIVPGMLADSWGRYNIMIFSALLCAVLNFASIAANNTASILVVGALYGFTSGTVVTLQGHDDPKKMGTAIGQMLSVSAFGALLDLRSMDG